MAANANGANTTTGDAPAAAGSTTTSTPTTTAGGSSIHNAVNDLSEALDDFIGDIERKFANMAHDVNAKLDELAERSDKVEEGIVETQRELEAYRAKYGPLT